MKRSQPTLVHRGTLATDLRPDQTLYSRLGGRPVIARIIDDLYNRIKTDSDLRPMFPGSLNQERMKQKAFFEEWIGGYPDYTQHHAYGGIKSRHRHIYITREAADRWLGHMTASLRDSIEDDTLVEEVLRALRALAHGLVNEAQPAQHAKYLRCHREKRRHKPKELAAKGRLKEFRQVIEADSNLLSDRNQAAEIMCAAVARGHIEIVAYLLDQGVDVNIPTPVHVDLMMTPLCVARWKKHYGLSDFLIQKGAIYDIFSAAYLGDLDGVSTFVSAKPALVHVHDPACDLLPITPLHHAVYGSNIPIVEYLLAQGTKAGTNSTPMIRSAANSGQTALVRVLLKHGADTTRIGPGKWVMEPEIAKLLLAHGADVNYPQGQWIWKSCTGNNSQRDDPAYVQALLNCGADITTELRGAQALHYAAKAGFVKILEVLLKNNARVNAINEKGETPLCYAFKAGKRADMLTMFRRLLESGADIYHKNHSGKTPWDMAQRLRRPDAGQIVELFRQ